MRMNTIQSLLDWDLSLLKSARHLVDPAYAHLVQIAGELVVIYWALLLIGLWLYGVYHKNNEFKKTALAIFFTIVTVFILYAIINLGIPKWRPGAIEAVKGIAPLIPHPIDNSFPSGHALFTGALLFGLVQYLRNTSLIILTIMIGAITLFARVVWGVHYPGDILWGLIFGIIGAYFLLPVVRFLITKITPFCLQIASWIHL